MDDDPLRRIRERREANARALAKFGAAVPRAGSAALERVVRGGSGPTLHTIGYEKRSPDDLLAALRERAVRVLVDVRDDPMSRRAAYRPDALRELVGPAGIVYEARRDLGAPKASRDELHATADLGAYLARFREHALRDLLPALDRLAARVAAGGAALLCYERRPEECHRSVLADLVAERLDATVIAIL